MLVLSRKVGEKLLIGDSITVIVNRVSGNRVTLGIEAPEDVRILRGELEEAAKQFEESEERPRGGSSVTGIPIDSDATFIAPRSIR